MARIRSVKPETPRDARLAKVSRGARYTFILLITQADDQGYFIATPRTLLGTLYPHDPDLREHDLVGELDELVRVGLLKPYDTPDGIIGHIVNFIKHQKIDHPSQPFLAKLSRKARETFAPGVLSLESLVLSPEQDKTARAREATTTTPPEPAGHGRGYQRPNENPGADRKPGEGSGMGKADFMAAVRKAGAA